MHLLVDAVQHGLLGAGRQLLPGGVQIEADRIGHALQQAQEVLTGLRAGPRRNRALRQTRFRIGHDQFGVDLLPGAEAGADRAGAERRVEGERARLELVDGQRMVVRAGETFRITALAVRVVLEQVDEVEDHHAAGQPQRRLDRVGDALPARCPDRFSCFFSVGGSVRECTTPSIRARA